MARNKTITKDEILDAAERVLVKHGVHFLTQDAVLVEAGISKGGLVYTYPTKDSLIEAMLERELGRFMVEARRHAESFEGHPYQSLLGYLKASQVDNEEYLQKFINLITALVHAPNTLHVAQKFYQQNTAEFFDVKNESGRKAQLAFLAVEGLVFLQSLGLKKHSKKEWDSIIEEAMDTII